jgi:hypothetical protein
MAKPKTYVLQLHFNSEKDLIEWSEGTTKRPYNVKKEDGNYIENCKSHTKKKYCVESFKDENAPEFKDLHPVAQGLRLGELLR